jgi:rod shape-determining protein MreD
MIATLALLALLAEAVRYVFFGRLPIQPDLLLGIVVLASLRLPPPRGAVVGLVLGLLRDLLVGTPVGHEALPMALIGWFVGLLGRSVYREAFVTQVLMTLGAGLVKPILTYAILRGEDLAGLPLYFLRIGAPSAILTAFLAPLGERSLLRPRPRRFAWSRTTLRRLREYEGKTLFKR